ncbi:unnamed protein product [Cuscuta epithymum]|uniref:Uncharacterized protein n=1 Tax=Cuscuta epithymum TaxID=186058 RepID=A0AAV0G918_9ASTE|nr:unnamed protein product [Cuscuta epithymum]CAH9144310.1 unnamed protein product [Cuscuta epithymum]
MAEKTSILVLHGGAVVEDSDDASCCPDVVPDSEDDLTFMRIEDSEEGDWSDGGQKVEVLQEGLQSDTMETRIPASIQAMVAIYLRPVDTTTEEYFPLAYLPPHLDPKVQQGLDELLKIWLPLYKK